MPIYWVASETAELIMSGEGQSLIDGYDIYAAFAAAGWVVAAVGGVISGIWTSDPSIRPALVNGVKFVWDTTSGGGGKFEY